MRAVRNTERGIEVVEVPEPADDDGVRVRIRSAGICGSDLTMIKAGPLPVTLGHEFAGVLDDGTPVAVEPLRPCATCDQCVAGNYQRCRLGGSIYVGVGSDGGMADEIRVPARAIVPLPTSLASGDACVVEPLSVAMHGFRLTGVEPSARVAVVGGGSIGLAAVTAALAAGAEVALVARHAHQVSAGERLGADPAAATGEYDLAVEAAGTATALEQAAQLAAPGGTVLMLGTFWGAVSVPGLTALMKELRVVWSLASGGHAHGRDFDDAAALLGQRPEIADTLITHRFPLDDAAEAFRVAGDRSAGAIKVVLEP
jgi:threonine dehydrogenase-like Zn-dependent dehydrogenase